MSVKIIQGYFKYIIHCVRLLLTMCLRNSEEKTKVNYRSKERYFKMWKELQVEKTETKLDGEFESSHFYLKKMTEKVNVCCM